MAEMVVAESTGRAGGFHFSGGAFRRVVAGVRGVLAMLRRACCASTVRDCYNDEIAARIHLEVFA
jgi:hypothetical protein